MRGVSAIEHAEIEKAGHYFELCLKESQNFHLARMQLANIRSKQGKPKESLALLDTLSSSHIYPRIEIEAALIRADVLDTQGKYDEAITVYQAIIDKYASTHISGIKNIRYDMSYSLTSLTRFEDALTQLNTLSAEIQGNTNPELLANVYQKSSSIYQTLGQTSQARDQADKALEIFVQLEDLPGQAKTLSVLGRIANHQSLYSVAQNYIEQSLRINQTLEYKLGIGSSLNELIYVMMVQGKFKDGLKLSTKMQEIAIEIDHLGMLFAAKQAAADITRSQRRWSTSKMYLDEHMDLAISTKSKRGLLKNWLLSLDYYMDTKKPNAIPEIIENIQAYIDESGELRLQPRIDKQLARYYLLTGDQSAAFGLLDKAKQQATTTQDGETLNEIHLLLAEYYLENNNTDKAQEALDNLSLEKTMPYPYLLFKSKVFHAKGQPIKALDFANQCKQKANEWWSREDEKYLQQLSQNP